MEHTYTLIGEPGPELEAFLEEVGANLEAHGFVHGDDPKDTDVVLNVVDPREPRPFRRKSRGTFVAALSSRDEEPDDGLRETYPMLVRALANIVLCYVPGERRLFTTMERGHYLVARTATARRSAEAVVERLVPLATSRLVIDNEFRTDLEPELWDGDEITREIARGRPAPRRARPAAGAVPDRGAARRARPAARQAAVRRSAASRTATSRRARTRRASG